MTVQRINPKSAVDLVRRVIATTDRDRRIPEEGVQTATLSIVKQSRCNPLWLVEMAKGYAYGAVSRLRAAGVAAPAAVAKQQRGAADKSPIGARHQHSESATESAGTGAGGSSEGGDSPGASAEARLELMQCIATSEQQGGVGLSGEVPASPEQEKKQEEGDDGRDPAAAAAAAQAPTKRLGSPALPQHLPVDSHLQRVVARGFDHLTWPQQEVLRAASVAGVQFSRDMVLDLLDRTVTELIVSGGANGGGSRRTDRDGATSPTLGSSSTTTTVVAPPTAAALRAEEASEETAARAETAAKQKAAAERRDASAGVKACFNKLVSAGFIVPRINRLATSYNSFAKLSLLQPSPGVSPCSTRSSDDPNAAAVPSTRNGAVPST